MAISKIGRYFKLVKETATSWMEHDAPRLGAALAFYTIFAIAPLFVIVLAIAGFVFGEETARRHLFHEVNTLVGEQSAKALEALVAAGDRSGSGTRATLIAVGTLFVGASGVFVQLQDALNTLWDIRRKPGQGVRRFLKVRLLSFAMVLAIGFLLLVSLVVNAGLSALGKYMSGWISGQETLWQAVNFVISLGVVTLLFALMFKILPDAKIAWRDVWVGALLTALLFGLGKFLLGLYLGKSSVASAYGAAGSLVVVVVWVYYSSQILLFGAAFTRLYASELGSEIQPAEGAHFVAIKEARTQAHPPATHKIKAGKTI